MELEKIEADKQAGQLKPPKKGEGSFWIHKTAIKELLRHKATALQIAAFLVIAKHTEASGRLSTSGIKAIHKATGVSHAVIQKAVDTLEKDYKIIYTAQAWTELTGVALPVAPFDRAKVRYVLNDYGFDEIEAGDKVWISNNLIDGYGKFTQPLKKLKMCGDVAARLLLIGYRESNLEQYGGINPSQFYTSYEMKKITSHKGFDLWHGEVQAGDLSSFRNVMDEALGLTGLSAKEKEKEKEKNIEFWDALQALDQAGFIYQMVSVMDRAANDADAQVIYELDAKSKHGYKPKGEEGLGGLTASLSNALGYAVTDASGRFYGKYAAIVPAGKPYIIGIYRLRFRITNSKNHGVADAWTRIYQGQREAKEWIDEMAGRRQSEAEAAQKIEESTIAEAQHNEWVKAQESTIAEAQHNEIARRQESVIADFNEFWKAYPKKVGKDKALESWIAKSPRIDDVMSTLRWQIESNDWQNQDGKYIPNPATYLNQGRWQDEPPVIDLIPF